MNDTVITCARCGSSTTVIKCESCYDGFNGHECGEDVCCCLHPQDNVPCDVCHGLGAWSLCLSSVEWCKANPLPGRESTERGTFETNPPASLPTEAP